MTIKIGKIQRFERFPSGTGLQLPGDRPREVKLAVNTEAETRFDFVSEDGEVTFLAVVKGRQNLEFIVDGPGEVVATSEGEVWLSTDEGRHLTYRSEKPSFVTLDFERSPALSEFERMQMIANLRREQREAEDRALFEAKMAELQEKIDAATQVPSDPVGGSGGEASGGNPARAEQPGEGEA